MAQLQNVQYFPYFPPHFAPPLPNSPPPRNPPSPPKLAPPSPPSLVPTPPPPPRHAPSPPPPPKLPLLPPPPPHTFSPPPPHPISPARPPPPHVTPNPPPQPHHSTVIIFVFVSIGAVFFLAFLATTLCCFIKKRKKMIVQETDKVKIDEHMLVHEDIVPGPHGTQTVVLTIDEDLHVEEEINKTSEVVKSKGSHLSFQAPEMGESTSIFKHHHHNLKE